MGGIEMIFIVVGFFALMYFLMIRPQKKRMESQRKLVDSITPGTRVMLNTGMFATVRAVGNQQVVVELAPGTEVTMLKQAVIKVVSAEDEEFDYDDQPINDTVDADVPPAEAIPAEEVIEDRYDEVANDAVPENPDDVSQNR